MMFGRLKYAPFRFATNISTILTHRISVPLGEAQWRKILLDLRKVHLCRSHANCNSIWRTNNKRRVPQELSVAEQEIGTLNQS